MKASGSSSSNSSSSGRSGGGKRKPPVPMQGRSKGKGTGASAKTPPTTAPTAAAAAPIPPAAAAAPTAPINPPPAVAAALAAAAAAAAGPVSVSARRQEVLARFNASEAQRKEQIQRQRASMRQEVASLRMGSPSPRSAAKAVEASAKGGETTDKRGVACPSPAAQEIESARGAGSVQAVASQFTGSSSVIETREMVMHRLMQEERTDRQARSAARELLAHFHGAHALFQGESHQAFLHRLKFESTAKEKALFLRAWARDRGLQGGAVSVAEGERFLRDIGLLSTGNNGDEKQGKEKGGGKKKKGPVALASAGAAGAGSKGGAAAPPSASSSVASVASSSSSSSSGSQRGPEAAEQWNEEWMALLATAVNDATIAAAAAANSGSTTTTDNNNNGSGDDADIETVSSLSSASVAMPGGVSVSVPTAPRRRLFNGAAAAGVDEEEEEGEEEEEEEEELGSLPSIETDVSLAPLMAGMAVGAGPSRGSSVATTGSVGSGGSNKAPAAVATGAEQWSNVSQDGSYEGADGEGEKPSGREAALVDGEEGEGVEGEEEDDEALRQLREKGFWFSDKMASLLPSTPSPLREGPAPKGKAPQE